MDWVGLRKWFLVLSLGMILPGVIFLILAPGLRQGIDFTGGSSLTIQFAEPVTQEDLRAGLTAIGVEGVTVQRLGDDSYFIRTKELSETERDDLLFGIQRALGTSGVELLAFDLVSPVLARDVIIKGFWAVFAAVIGIFLYMWWAFRNMSSPFRYGAAAILALVHDTLIVVGVFAILGVVADIEVNTMFLIALLTTIGFSVNDTIVVFDRLRENVSFFPGRTLSANVNLSISETFSRSVNTSATLLVTILALLLFGGPTIRDFLLVLLIGVAVGTYSSIAVASQFLVLWDQFGMGWPFNRKQIPTETGRTKAATN
ncbi:MAG: protein translocase subunit SecF [Chloroflexi bacterium]|nr:protein translocase subunit SecF [Chloroflexota bacterium]